MPRIPTKFVIADVVFAAVRTALGPFADFLDDSESRPYDYLRVIGADWGDLIPARPRPHIIRHALLSILACSAESMG